MPAAAANLENASSRRVSAGSSAPRSKKRSMPGAARAKPKRKRAGVSPAFCQVCGVPLGMKAKEPAAIAGVYGGGSKAAG
jgi:hypothetical protein